MVLRRFLVGVGVAALVVSLTPVIAARTAGATTELSCAASVPLYRTSSTGAFFRHEHLDPETGGATWAGPTQLTSWGLDARRIAGPNGDIYSAVNTGELRRRRWNGTGWDTFGGGAQYEVIDRDPAWARYVTPEYRNLITIDTLGDIYTVEADNNLHWRRYDSTIRTWTHRIVNDRWGNYDLITAAGPGVIYRRLGESLERFEYHAESQRSRIQWLGSAWDQFSRIFSPGADILYAVHAGTGDLMWYRYNPETDTWANGVPDPNHNSMPAGTRIATGWQNDYESSAAPGSCWLTGASRWPTRPVVTPVPQPPVTLTVSSDRRLHYSYVDEDGRAVHAHTASASGGTPLSLEAVPGMINLTGPVSLYAGTDNRYTVAGLGLDAEMRTNTKASATGPWLPQAVNLGGYFSKPISLNPINWCRQDYPYTNEAYAAFAVDHDDTLWSRSVLGRNGPNVPVGTWTQTPTDPIPAGDGPLIVKSRRNTSGGNCLDLFYYDRTTTSFAFLHAQGFENWWAGSIALEPGSFLSQPSIFDFMGQYTAFATGTDGTVHAAFHAPNGVRPGAWIAIPGVDAAGPPSAIVAPDNRFKVVVRGTDGQIYWTSQTAYGATTFTPWLAIPGTANAGTDPTAQAFDNTWVVAYRTDVDFPRLRPFVPALTATESGTFADIPVRPAP